jgi:hypothetical protein
VGSLRGVFWEAFGKPFGHLGGTLGSFLSTLGPLWANFGSLGGLWGTFGVPCGFGVPFGRLLGSFLGTLGTFLGSSFDIPEVFRSYSSRSSLGVPGIFLRYSLGLP